MNLRLNFLKNAISIVAFFYLLVARAEVLQAQMVVASLPNQGATSTLRAPSTDSSSAYRSAVFYINKHEMAPYRDLSITSMSIPIAGNLNTLAAVGNFTLKMSNYHSPAPFFGSTFSSNTTGMSTVFVGTLSIPAAGGQYMVVNYQTPFHYTGEALKIAYNWTYAGPYTTNSVSVWCSNSYSSAVHNGYMVYGASVSSSVLPLPTTCSLTTFRPSFLFGALGPVGGDIGVLDAKTERSKITQANSGIVQTYVCNSGSTAVQNVSVNLVCGGMNSFTQSVVIPNFPATSTQTITFGNISTYTAGLCSFSVEVLNQDSVPANNVLSWLDYATCNNSAASHTLLSFPSFWNLTTPRIFANKYFSPQTNTVTGIRIKVAAYAFTNTPVIAGVITDVNGNIVASSNTVNVPSTALGPWIDLPFTNSYPLNSGQDYYYGVSHVSGQFPVGAIVMDDIATTQPYYLPLAGGTPSLSYYTAGLDFGMFMTLNTNTLAITTNSTQYLCIGSAITLTATGAPSYSWSNGTFGASTIVTPTVSGYYTVTGYNTNCNITKTVTVRVSPTVAASITPPANKCVGNVTFSANTAYSYTWSNGGNYQNSTYYFSTPGVQQVSVSVENAPCPVSTAVAQITVIAAPAVSVVNIPAAICNAAKGGTPLQISSYPPGGVFSGSGISSTGSFTPTVNGTYSIQYTYTSSVTGCVGTTNAELLVNECTVISRISAEPEFALFPNPSADGILFTKSIERGTLRVYSLSGALLHSVTFSDNTINLKEIQHGLYFLVVEDAAASIKCKQLVQIN